MSTTACARCKNPMDSASASFSEEGLVCPRCHGNERARDDAQLAAAVADAQRAPNLAVGGSAIEFTQRTMETRNADGSVARTETADLDGWAMRFFRRVFGK